MEAAQTRLMLVLAAVLLVVVGLVVGWDASDGDPGATEPIWDLEMDDVDAVRLDRADGSRVVLERRDEHWQVLEPFEARADDQRTVDVLDAVREIDWGVPVAGEVDAAELGLEPPRVVLAVTTADGVRSLAIGDDAPVGYQTYARAPSGRIVTVRGSHSALLTRPARDFRDHRAFRFDPARVRRVTIDGPEGVLDVHGQGTRWWLTGFTRADPASVDQLVYGLLDIRVAEYLEDRPPIDDGVFRVSVALEDGTLHELRVGEQEGGGIRVDTDRGLPAVAIPQTLTLLVQGPTDVGDAYAFVVDLERTDRVQIAADGHTWEATRDGPAWRVDGAEASAAHAVLAALDAATIHYRREPVPAVEAPWVTVRTAAGDDQREVVVGQRLGDHRVARDAGGGEPFLIPMADLAFLSEEPLTIPE